ncbi:MAG: tRNA lysidine(34) synthetase TilS [Muribaculaceae bacterium]|nr:tRNA lysidine(34) synthetase TilS [Muribaculaceae bacterium]
MIRNFDSDRIRKSPSDIIGNLENRVGEIINNIGVRRIVAGVSGGADSVALLLSLLNSGVEIVAVHCDFHLRGEESERDLRFVEQLCRRLSVELEIVHFDVDSYRKDYGGSVEMACRDLRYDYFRKEMKNRKADRIAVAHNADDNAETVLLNLFRGGGVAGLSAISPDTGEVIRPLLTFSRSEIEKYLEAKGEKYVIDSTNLSSDYKRNFIRNQVIPLIEKEWPGVKKSLCRTATIMREEREAAEALEKKELAEDFISKERILEKGLGRWRLRRFVLSRGGTQHNVEEMWKGLKQGSATPGSRWIAEGGEFIMDRDKLEWVEKKYCSEGISIEEEFKIEQFDNSHELLVRIKKETDNSALWLGINPDNIGIRTRMNGDRIYPLGMKGSRLVSDILSESGLSQAERRKIGVAYHPLTGEIIWVEGLKRSRRFLVSPEDKKVWRVSRKS